MNLSDTFYIALCMTVLILGTVYWFWTQNQYMQRKVNLLENIVYEMKSSLQGNVPGAPAQESLPAPFFSEDEEAEHSDLMNQIEAPGEDISGLSLPPVSSAPIPESVPEALRPGAPMLEVDAGADVEGKGSVLETMTLKELRRLADQKGISGTASMRKPALIEAIKAKPESISPFEFSEATLDLN